VSDVSYVPACQHVQPGVRCWQCELDGLKTRVDGLMEARRIPYEPAPPIRPHPHELTDAQCDAGIAFGIDLSMRLPEKYKQVERDAFRKAIAVVAHACPEPLAHGPCITAEELALIAKHCCRCGGNMRPRADEPCSACVLMRHAREVAEIREMARGGVAK